MRDLELWRRLVAGTATADELAAVAAWPMSRRAPLLAWIAPLAASDDPSLRAAAYACLSGARGVPGLRAIVGGLEEDDPALRAIAIEALRESARDAPYRFAHALFHPEVAVRRAALSGEAMPAMAIRLRADPACADLATGVPWPDQPLPLAFELHARGCVSARELVELVVVRPATEVRGYFHTTRVAQRSSEVCQAFLDRCERDGITTPPGTDILDRVIAAIVEAGTSAHALGKLVEIATPHSEPGLRRRTAVALIGQLVRTLDPALVPACAGLVPSIVAFPGFSQAWVDAAIDGIVRTGWHAGVRSREDIERLLRRRIVRAPLDLALAAAIVGFAPNDRLALLELELGEAAILDALVASDRGWDVICKLPPEKPAHDLAWLAKIERVAPRRYIALVGRALAMHAGTRLDAFVTATPPARREDAFFAALTCDRAADAERLGTICHALAPRLGRSVLAALLARLPAEPVRELVRAVTDKDLASAASLLDDDAALRVIAALDGPDPPPRDRELALAQALAARPSPALHEWIARVMPPDEPRILTSTPPPRARHALDAAQATNITGAAFADLGKALAPALATPVVGLTAALARRPCATSAVACAALLGCADPIADVARELDRFGGIGPRFDDDLDHAAASAWLRRMDLPALADARLWRWEHHQFGLADWIVRAGGAHAALAAIEDLPGVVARRTLWRGIAEVLRLFRYRDPPRYRALATDVVAGFCADRIDRDIGASAARIVLDLVESGIIALASVRDRLLDRIADASPETRGVLSRVVRLDGLPPPPPLPRALPDEAMVARLRASEDLDELARYCTDPRAAVAHEAALVLATRGEPGQLRLAAHLRDLRTLPHPFAVVSTVVLWDSPRALAVAREIVAAPLPPAWEFHLCLALARQGDAHLVPRVFAAARVPDPSWGLRNDDWQLLHTIAPALACATELADSPHHHGYRPAVAFLLACEDELAAPALARFLEVDGERPRHLRLAAAIRLAERWGDARGLPLVVEDVCDERTERWQLSALPADARARAADMVVAAALVGGHTACSEKRMWHVLDGLATLIPSEQLAALHARVLDEASTAVARRAAAQLSVRSALARSRLVRVAEVFAWGVRRGVELTGRMFTIHLTGSEKEFGHTRLTGNRIFVSPLPMLREEAHGRDVVEGLVLHEIGHHVYHRGAAAQELWRRAHAEGIGHLLNLVADEHLERNLRGQDAAYGDRLKRLGAYAFHHAPQEIQVATLLDCLGASAADALIATPLEVAFDDESLRLRRGAVLAELDRVGHPLARFSRALRMGLGNRHGDPLIADALGKCKNIRALDMPGLYDLTRELAAMFGGAVEIARVFGGPEGLEFGERDADVFGAGIDDDILQREVERILHPPEHGSRRDGDGRPERLQLNVNPDDDFRRITHIQRIRGDAEQHRVQAAEVSRHAARLRGYLDELGLRWLPVHARTRGRALDRTRLVPLVTRLDPRILVAREPVRRTDLFVGVLVDCSGSMEAGDNIERARRFAVLVAEAVKPLPGVHARFFGFTDSTIYDAGDAHDCHVTGLETDGGNNDAAALWHAANVALSAPQRAKVLVMISDGLPTECSVSALRSLVTNLTRRKGIVCAQVAVRALEEVCFPHHVTLDDADLDVAIARFGRMIADLARRSLAS